MSSWAHFLPLSRIINNFNIIDQESHHIISFRNIDFPVLADIRKIFFQKTMLNGIFLPSNRYKTILSYLLQLSE